jgi:hypothetical protein
MTVSIAALAEGGRRIVIVTDKQFTGDYKIEKIEPKAGVLPMGWIVTYAGDPTFADEAGHRAVPSLRGVTDPIAIADTFHSAFNEQWRHAVKRDVLARHYLRPGSEQDENENAQVDQEIEKYARDDSCDFLLCGFDSSGLGHIFKIGLGAHVQETAFAAIGSGSTIAEYRLAWRKTAVTDSIQRVVYEVYEAKLHAELDPYVGEAMDFWVMTENLRKNATGELDGMSQITPETQKFLNRVFRYFDQTPFRHRANLRLDESLLDRPGEKWEDELDECLRGVLDASGSSSENAPPSSQLRSGVQQ